MRYVHEFMCTYNPLNISNSIVAESGNTCNLIVVSRKL